MLTFYCSLAAAVFGFSPGSIFAVTNPFAKNAVAVAGVSSSFGLSITAWLLLRHGGSDITRFQVGVHWHYCYIFGPNLFFVPLPENCIRHLSNLFLLQHHIPNPCILSARLCRGPFRLYVPSLIWSLANGNNRYVLHWRHFMWFAVCGVGASHYRIAHISSVVGN